MLVTEVDEPLNVVPPVFIKVKPPLEAACHFNPVLVELSATKNAIFRSGTISEDYAMPADWEIQCQQG
jgi:hypothetical protein